MILLTIKGPTEFSHGLDGLGNSTESQQIGAE